MGDNTLGIWALVVAIVGTLATAFLGWAAWRVSSSAHRLEQQAMKFEQDRVAGQQREEFARDLTSWTSDLKMAVFPRGTDYGAWMQLGYRLKAIADANGWSEMAQIIPVAERWKIYEYYSRAHVLSDEVKIEDAILPQLIWRWAAAPDEMKDYFEKFFKKFAVTDEQIRKVTGAK